MKKASNSHETLKEKETPIELLETAYRKLTHENMDLTAIRIGDYGKACKLAGQIKQKADELENQIYHYEKDLKKLKRKKT